MATRIRKQGLRTVSSALALALTLVACGDDEDPVPGGPVISAPDSGTQGPLDSGVGLDAGLGNGAPTDGAVPNTPVTDCTNVNGCVCNAKTSLELLNSCTTGACTPFDNSKRLQGFTGTLQPIP